jgi:hypothetical protein
MKRYGHFQNPLEKMNRLGYFATFHIKNQLSDEQPTSGRYHKNYEQSVKLHNSKLPSLPLQIHAKANAGCHTHSRRPYYLLAKIFSQYITINCP